MAQPDDPASGEEKIELTEADVDGAYLEEPLEKHTVNALKFSSASKYSTRASKPALSESFTLLIPGNSWTL